jgi:hypothetical protein
VTVLQKKVGFLPIGDTLEQQIKITNVRFSIEVCRILRKIAGDFFESVHAQNNLALIGNASSTEVTYKVV